VELEFQAGRALTIEQRKKVQQYLDINGDVNVKAFFSSTETRKRDNCEKLRARYIRRVTVLGGARSVGNGQKQAFSHHAKKGYFLTRMSPMLFDQQSTLSFPSIIY